jgi:NADH-quinone oxidoreductase subunit H
MDMIGAPLAGAGGWATIGVAPFAQSLGDQILAWLKSLYGHVMPASLVQPAADLTAWLGAVVAIIVVLLVVMLYSTWVERKVVGRIQDRYGPNRVGKFGLLQPFADMLKIVIKEDTTPAAAHRWVYNLGALLIVPPALIVFAVIPFGAGLGGDLSVGLPLFIAVSATAVLPIFMAGWGSRNKYALLGSMRGVAQVVSYEIPQVLSVVGVLLMAGTLSLQSLVYSQGPISSPGQPTFPGIWYVLLQPIAFLIFLIATAAEIERSPFDIPEADSEIVAGYHIEYSGVKFGMFYLAIYIATIAASALGAVLFLGGWQPPLAALSFIPGPIWFGLKTYLLVLVFMWLRGTLPRLRVDQLMGFAWKVLVPLALGNLLVAGLVGKLAYNGQQAAAPGSFQASPLFPLLGFSLGNIVLVGAALGLATWWQRQVPPSGCAQSSDTAPLEVGA